MELWIRSQDKEKLVKAEEIKIERDFIGDSDTEIFYINTAYDELGKYKTKERALEVLDEIQTNIATLNYQYLNRGKNFILTESNVYEMPIE